MKLKLEKKEKKVVVSISITPSLLKKLKTEADSYSMPLSELVTRYLKTIK